MENLKNAVLVSIFSLFALSTFGQGKDTVVVEATKGNNSSTLRNWSCHRTANDGWNGDCFTNSSVCREIGTSVVIGICATVCVSSQRTNNSGNGNGNANSNTNMELLDVQFTFTDQGTPIDPIELLKMKTGSFTFSDDVFILGKEEGQFAIVKAGTYKVTNGKMHTLIGIN